MGSNNQERARGTMASPSAGRIVATPACHVHALWAARVEKRAGAVEGGRHRARPSPRGANIIYQ
jgi:hypothetical protein